MATVARLETQLTANTAQHDRAMRDSEKAYDRVASRARAAVGDTGSFFGGLVKGAARITAVIGAAGLGGLALGFGKAATSGLGFNNSMEQVTAQLNAFTKNGALSAQILDMIRVRAAKTPFAFEEMAKATAGLIPAARQANVQLEGLVETAEILAASNPAEGLEGAAFALREAVSGDFTSIIERFNLPRTYINQLKDEGVPALEIVRKSMQMLGYDTDLVSNLAETASGRWSTFLDTLQGLAATVTAPIFDRFSEGLGQVNQWLTDNTPMLEAFAAMLADGIGGAIEWIKARWEDAQPIFQAAGDALGNIIPAAANVAGEVLGTLSRIVMENIIPAFMEIGAWAGEHLPPLLDGFARLWRETLGPALKGFADVITQTVLPKLLELFTFIVENADAVAVAFLVVMLPAAVTAFAGIIAAAAPLILTIGAIAGAAIALKLAWQTNFANIRGFFVTAVDFWSKAFAIMGHTVLEFARFVNRTLNDLITGTLRVFALAMAIMGDKAGADLLNNFIKSIEARQHAVDVSLLRMEVKLQNFAMRAAAWGAQAGGAFANNFAVTVSEGLNRVGAWAENANAGGPNAPAFALPKMPTLALPKMPSISLPKMPVTGAGGGGGGAGGGGGSATEAVRPVILDLADAARMVQQFMAGLSATFDTLAKFADFKRPTEEAMNAFADTVDYLADRFKQIMFKWNAETLELAGQFGEGMGKLIGGMASTFATFKGLEEFKKPSDEAMTAFRDAVDFLSEAFKQVMFKWNEDTLEVAALFGEGVGKLITGLGAAIKPLTELQNFKPLAKESVDAFYEAVAFLTEGFGRAASLFREWVGPTGPPIAEDIGKVIAGLGAAVKPLIDLQEFKALSKDAVDNFYTSLAMLIRGFGVAASKFREEIGPVGAEVAEDLGAVMKGINDAIAPLLKLPDVQKIDPGAIEGAFANVWLALHHFNEVMKSGELQGEWQNKAVAFAETIRLVFAGIAEAIEFLLSKDNPDGIVMVWRNALNDIFQFTTGVWQPQLEDRMKTWFSRMTGYFNTYTAEWVSIWTAAMGALVPPPLPDSGKKDGENPPPKDKESPVHGRYGNYQGAVVVQGSVYATVPNATRDLMVGIARRDASKHPGRL